MTVTHRMSNLPEYNIWIGIKTRCYNPKNHVYKWYGKRGIIMCDKWKESFVSFYEDMGARPTKDHSIDRIDSNGPYSPDNCRWVNHDEQANNMSTNHRITYNGKTQSISDWAKELNIPYSRLRARILSEMSIEKAFSKSSLANVHPITHKGETRTIAEWARFTGINEEVISSRLLNGWTIENSLTQPIGPYAGCLITFEGETKNLSEWAKKIGISLNGLIKRLRKWTIERALTTPPHIEKITHR